MAANCPPTDEERESVRRYHAEGHSLRWIAKELGRGAGTIQAIAREFGLSFDQRPTAKATAMKVEDNKARRARIIGALYDVAEDDIKYLNQPDGYDLVEVSAGQAVEYHLARLPAQDRKALVGAISTGAQAAVRLEQVDSDETQLPLVDQWLRAMMCRDAGEQG
jgi:hypothetical protein